MRAGRSSWLCQGTTPPGCTTSLRRRRRRSASATFSWPSSIMPSTLSVTSFGFISPVVRTPALVLSAGHWPALAGEARRARLAARAAPVRPRRSCCIVTGSIMVLVSCPAPPGERGIGSRITKARGALKCRLGSGFIAPRYRRRWGLGERSDGDAPGSLLPRRRRGTELHARRRALQRRAAVADAGDQASRGRARRAAVQPRAGEHAPVRARADGEALSGAGLRADARGQAPGARFRQAQEDDPQARGHVHDRAGPAHRARDHGFERGEARGAADRGRPRGRDPLPGGQSEGRAAALYAALSRAVPG